MSERPESQQKTAGCAGKASFDSPYVLIKLHSGASGGVAVVANSNPKAVTFTNATFVVRGISGRNMISGAITDSYSIRIGIV